MNAMNFLPDPYIALKFVILFALGFENSRYLAALRAGTAQNDTDVGTGPVGRMFIGGTSWVHGFLMVLFVPVRWYDFGFIKTLILYGGTILIVAPLISGILMARVEYYFKEALWGYASILIYPSAIWLAFSFSWFGILAKN
jgi:hypothetical protein